VGISSGDCEKLGSSLSHPWYRKCHSIILPMDFIFNFKLCQSLISAPQVQIIFTQRRNAISEPKFFSFLAKA